MSSPKNLIKEGRSPLARIQLDLEETMPQGNKILIQNSLQYTNTNSDLSFSSSNVSSPSTRRSQPRSSDSSFMDGEVVPSKLQQQLDQEQDKQIIPENKCKVKGHKKEDLIYVCTVKECTQILMCKRCKRKHNKDHQSSIKLLDDWFNKMFGRRVEDSDNNKVSRKCGMNLGKLAEQLRTYQVEIDARKATIEKQTQQFIEMITLYIKQKHNESIKRLDAHFQAKNQLLEEYHQTYKKLKGLNRFTILENLKRQHNPNSEQPPLIPIQSIIRFLLENEKQYSDSQQIENQHKGFSKLIRDTDSLEQTISNETKSLIKLAATDEGKPDYLIRDSPIIQRMQDYIDFLYYFEKGIPKKTQSYFRSGTLNFDEEEYSNILNTQVAGNNASSTNLSFTNQCQRMQSNKPIPGLAYRKFFANANVGNGESTNRIRLTAEEVLKFSRPNDQPQANLLKQIQQQDEGDFIIQKQKEKKLQNNGQQDNISDDEEKEEVEYECLVQENFNNAQFIDFNTDSIRVFGDQSVQLYDIKGGQFNKKDNLKAQQEIISHDQEMYEIGAIEEVYFFQNTDFLTNGMPLSARGLGNFKQIGSGSLRNDSILADDDSSQIFDLNYNSSQPNLSHKRLPILIIGLKSDPAKIEIWDMNTNEKIIQYLQAHDCSITCIQILEIIPNKSVLFAVGSYDGIIKTWLFSSNATDQSPSLNGTENNIESSEKLNTPPTYTLTQQLIMKCHTDFVTNMILYRIKDNPAKECLISAGSDKKMILWNWKSEEIQNENSTTNTNLNNPVLSPLPPIQENPSAESKPAPEEQKQSTTEEVKKKPPFLKKQIKLISFSKNTISSNASTTPSETNNGQNKAINEKQMRKPLKVMDNVHSDKINCFEILDDGLLATGSSDNTIKIWDMDVQTEQKVLQNKYIVNNISRLKRGTLVCSANNVKMAIYLINIWNWESGQIIGTIKGHTNRITKIHVIPNLFGECSTDPFYNKIITCERNKVIRIWKQSNADGEDFGRPLNSQEDDMGNSPSSIRSHISKAYSFYGYNPAEEFLNLYNLQMDPSLTPKLNMARITSQNSLPLGPHDKTPISNLFRGSGLNGQTTPQNANLYFSAQQNQQSRHQFNPTFSQQNNLLQQQYIQIAQQVQVNNGSANIIKQPGIPYFSPPKTNNQPFKFNNDEQSSSSSSLNFSPILPSPQLISLGSPLKSGIKNASFQSVPPLSISQQIQPNSQIISSSSSINQNSPPITQLSNELVNVSLNSNNITSNNIFQQQTNASTDLQKIIDKVSIESNNNNNNLRSCLENQGEPNQQINEIENVTPCIDLKQQQETPQMIKRNYQEIGNMLAPLEEANESEYNSPVDGVRSNYHPLEQIHSFTIDSSKFKTYSRENSNENNEISIYQSQQSTLQNEDQQNGNLRVDQFQQNRILNKCKQFSQIIERSPASETSSSSGNNSEFGIALKKQGSNQSNDFNQDLKNSTSSSPNASDYPIDQISGLQNNLKIKSSQSQDSSPSKELRQASMKYQIKLNGVHKYGSLEVKDSSTENYSSSNKSIPSLNGQIISQNTSLSQEKEIPANNNHLSIFSQQNQQKEQQQEPQQEQQIKSENNELKIQELVQENNLVSSASLLPPVDDEKKNIAFSQSAPSSPTSLASNPLLKKQAALSKTKKSSRNIFQN